MREAELFDPLIAYLTSQGYKIESESRGGNHGVDIIASKNGRKLYVELKGDSAALSVDFGTLLYQIMRYMKAEGTDEYAIGISEKYAKYARECMYAINKLGITVFLISQTGVKVLF